MSWFIKLLLIFWVVPSASFARGFYFSSSTGNDAHTWDEAQHAAKPWKTIDRLNSISGLLRPGDTVYFKRGDRFFGSIQLSVSGTNGQPIVFTAYSTGATPVISGLQKIAVSRTGDMNIYSFHCNSCSANTRILMLDHKLQRFGRYPDQGLLSYSSLQDKTTGVNVTMNRWLGGEVVIRKERWILDAVKISNDTNAFRTLSSDIKKGESKGFGYFIQKHISTLNQHGEWYYDPGKKMGFIYLKDAQAHTIELGVVDELFTMLNAHYVEINGLSFNGSNMNGISIKGSGNTRVIKCSVTHSGMDGISIASSNNIIVDQCTLDQSLNNGIKADPYSPYVMITRNRIFNSGMIPGMGRNGTGTYESISCQGDKSLVENNYIRGSGYNAIFFGGEHSMVRKNIISAFCQVKDDGAAIYTGDHRSQSEKTVEENHIDGSTRNKDSIGIQYVEGIYIDDQCRNVLIRGNYVKNVSNCGIKIHNAAGIRIWRNFLSGNKILLELNNNVHKEGFMITGVDITGNYFYSTDPSCKMVSLRGIENNAYRMSKNYFNWKVKVAAFTMTQTPVTKRWN